MYSKKFIVGLKIKKLASNLKVFVDLKRKKCVACPQEEFLFKIHHKAS
jgi:hypothetical protein